MALLTKPVWGWSLYDLANTAFSALFITFFFPVFIKVYLGGNEFHIGLTMGIALFLAAIFVPFIGAWSDALQRRKPFILWFTLTCVTFTVLVAFSNLWWALVFGTLAALFYHAALDVYDALLTSVATKSTIGKISGIGTALGYFGTILSLGMAYLILNAYGWNTKIGLQLIFVGTAAFYLFFAIFLFMWTPDASGKGTGKFGSAARQAVLSLKDTFMKVRQNKAVWLFLVASLLYTDGMNTAIVFLYLYGLEVLKISIQQFFPVFTLMALAAGVGSLIFGKVTDALGPKRTLQILVGIWVGVIGMLILKTTWTTYVLAGIFGGAALGGVWTATRPMLVALVPKGRVGEYLGFQGLTEKFSGVFGPPVFGFLAVKYSYASALWSVIVFFVLGFIVLLSVRKK